jgi:hypothetical protein
MTSSEIQTAFDRFMARVAAILTPEELAVYRAYHRRLEASVARHDPNSIAIQPAEQAVLDTIEADTEATALRKAYSVLTWYPSCAMLVRT